MQNITLLGASYPNVPSVVLPKTGGGSASFTDVTDTTAGASDVASGKYFYTSAGVRTQGTNSGGGSSKNVQVAQSTTRATSSTYTEVISLTCNTTGTYDVYWSTFRSSTSGTWGSQLYIDDSAYGSAQTGSWSNHIQNIHLTGISITVTGISITANQEVAVRVRTRGNNYYGYVGTLTIKQTT